MVNEHALCTVNVRPRAIENDETRSAVVVRVLEVLIFGLGKEVTS